LKILYLYYNQPEAIKHLESIGLDNSPFEVIIIDDGSKPKLKCNWATVYRIEEDIPWNMSRANNLGLSKINSNETVLRLDIDHWFDLEDLNKLSKVDLKPKEIIKFDRLVYSKENYKTKPPPNIYLARVSDLISVGGYNESFCGNYGYEDKELMHRLKMNGFKEKISKDVIVKTKANLHTKKLNRDLSINKNLYYELIK